MFSRGMGMFWGGLIAITRRLPRIVRQRLLTIRPILDSIGTGKTT